MTDVEFILRNLRTCAVVGCSPSPRRDSHRIASLLKAEGYRVIPVNPECDEVLGERCHPVLPAGEGIEVVDLFRRSSKVSAHVDEAIAIGAKAVNMKYFYGHLISRKALIDDRFWPYPRLDSFVDEGILINRSGHRFVDEGRGDVAVANELARSDDDSDGEP